MLKIVLPKGVPINRSIAIDRQLTTSRLHDTDPTSKSGLSIMRSLRQPVLPCRESTKPDAILHQFGYSWQFLLTGHFFVRLVEILNHGN